MVARHDGDALLRDVDAVREALGVDVREVVLRLLGVLVRHVEQDVVLAAHLHLVVDGAGHDVARRQRQAWVVLLHELLAVQRAQYAAVAAHGLGDEEVRMVARVVERRGVELHELHVGHRALGAVHHRYAVARGHGRIGRRLVDGTDAAGRHHRYLGQIGVDLARLLVEHVGTVALDVGCAARHLHAQVVLRQYLDGEVVVQHFDVRVGLHGAYQGRLYLCSRVVGVVQDAELRVSALAVQVEVAVLLAVELHAPLHHLAYLLGAALDHEFHGLRVAQPVACHHRVVDMLVEVVEFEVRDGGHAALCKVGVGLFQFGLAYQRDASGTCHLERETHAGNAATDDEEIVFLLHIVKFTV